MVHLVGVDIGGSSVKAAVVDVATGALVSDLLDARTPTPATPDVVLSLVVDLVRAAGGDGAPAVGCAFPGRLRDGRVAAAGNLDAAWLDADPGELLGARLGRRVAVLNDADAAGLAEMTFGAGVGRAGVVVVVTLGTGVGTALFHDGRLVPGVELGELRVDGVPAEEVLGRQARRRLPSSVWRRNLEELLSGLAAVADPALVVLGGGGSEHDELLEPVLAGRPGVVRARLGNAAGVVGAALHAAGGDPG